MNPIVLNVLAIIGGLVIGSMVNMGIITIGGELIPLPAGTDVSTTEGLANAMQQFELKHFVSPFLAHALGTLVGAMFAAKVAASRQFLMAMIIGVAFLAGGTVMVLSVPSPLWFNALDLIVAYIPMAFLGHKLMLK